MNSEDIKALIATGFACEHIEVEGDGRHWFAVIVSSAFEGQSRVQRQRMVNATVQAKMATDELHALSMKTLTPAEWQAAQA
ncbi:MAG: BolA family transcriptional regulator [Comamonas sp.]|jgi:acid stress-induced BolA-like protein IbaG/YrbA|nr:BolA family transcriptional regulator [Comamonas sp.]